MLDNKKILVTNDDGIRGTGLIALVEQLYKYTHDIVVLVPSVEMSGISHARYFGKPLDFLQVSPIYKDVKTYTLSSTPADCVRFAISYLNLKPDFVISGMNNGLNMGDDILYSGTCGAGFEAALMGFKALCFSCDVLDFQAADAIPDVIKYVESHDLMKYQILNINLQYPYRDICITRQGYNEFETVFHNINNKMVSKGTKLTSYLGQDENTDVRSFELGNISITPLTTDRTAK